MVHLTMQRRGDEVLNPGKQVVNLTMHGRGDVVLGYLTAGNEYMFHLFGVLLFAIRPNMIK